MLESVLTLSVIYAYDKFRITDCTNSLKLKKFMILYIFLFQVSNGKLVNGVTV